MKLFKEMLIFLGLVAGTVKSVNEVCGSDLQVTFGKDCYKYSSTLAYCCYLYSADDGSSADSRPGICYRQHIANYTTDMTDVTYDGVDYKLSCPDLESAVKCADSPSYYDDCYAYSTADNSCCYYAYGGKTGCFFYGSKFSGETFQGGITFHCNGFNLLLSAHLLMIVFLFLA